MRPTLSNEKTGLKKGPWTPEEDQKLVDYIRKHGPGNWRHLPDKAGLQRCGKSCRLRWTNYLRPDIKRGKFSSEEEEFIIQLHSVVGNKWSAIAAKLPGRTDNEIKNYWNTHIRKRLLEMGIDPVTHGPRLDLLDFTSILTSLHHTSSSPNILTLLNLQTLLNPQLPNLLATTPLTSSQNEILTNTSFLSKTLTNAHLLNQIDSQVRNYSTFDKPNMAENPSKVSSTETYHSWFLETKHVNAKLNHNSYAQDDHGSIHPNESNPSFINNYGGVSLDFSSPCSSLAHPLDASHIYLNSSPCIEEEEEIDCFFNNIYSTNLTLIKYVE